MAITDHVAILTHSALAQAQPNRKKAGNPLQFYGVFAFPPTAGPDLQEVLKAAAPGGKLEGLSISVRRNSQVAKPIPGVPGDWFVIRAATQFPPYVADEAGKQLSQDTQAGDIRVKFYPGKRVRVALSAYFWPNEGGGLSFNLNGVMAVSDGERLPIGNTAANAFAGYADPNAAAAGGSAADPFGGATKTNVPSASTASADPFHQPAKTQTANPFA